MLGLSIPEIAAVQARGGAPVPSPTPGPSLSVGATWGLIGDGLQAEGGGVAKGPPNAAQMFGAMMSGRLQPVTAPILALSGTTIKTQSGSNYPWIYPYAIDALVAQEPDVFIVGTMGANDNVLSQDPSGSWMQDWKDAVSYAYAGFAAYAGGDALFVVGGTFASTKAGETTWRAAAWGVQAAHVAALGGGTDPRVIWVATDALLPASDYSIDSSSSHVHFDERGGYAYALAIKNAIDGYVENKTPDEIADLIAAGTYPLMSGSQLDSDADLAGTGGSVTGPGITGLLATSKVITNTTGATGITVAQTPSTGGRTKTVVTLTGSSSTSGKIMLQDKANISVTATPGQYIRTGAIVRNPLGLFNFGADHNGGFYGSFVGNANSIADNIRVGGALTQAVSGLFFTHDLAVYGNNSAFSGKRSWAIFYRGGSPLSGTFEIERPFIYLVSERTRHAPVYLGNLANSNSSALVFTLTNHRLRATGTVTQAGGGTVRVETGIWAPRGLTETDFIERRIYKGTVSDTGVGSGTLLATLAGSTWTYAIAAGGTSTGDRIYVEVDVDNGVGGTITARSVTTITVV